MGESRSRRKGHQDREHRYVVASQWQLMSWRFLRHKLAVAALAILGIFYLIVIFAEFVAPYDPYHNDAVYLHAPPQRLRLVDDQGRFHLWPFVYGWKSEVDPIRMALVFEMDTSVRHPLALFVKADRYRMWGLIASDIHLFGVRKGTLFVIGADKMGRDLLTRVIYGSRISLTIGLVGVAISFVLGILIGGVSGYFGGIADIVIQRIIEFIRSIPTLPLWMALSLALPPYWSIIKVYFGIVIILSLVGWTDLARVVRGRFLSLKEEDFVQAARLNGCSRGRIISRHLLPSFYSYVIASLTLSIPGMIIGETALSFIGLGLQPPAISWGVLLKEAQHIRVLANAPWLLIPSIFVIIAILAFNFVGDGLRDAADPYTAV